MFRAAGAGRHILNQVGGVYLVLRCVYRNIYAKLFLQNVIDVKHIAKSYSHDK